jgi:hypothetical protein
MARGKMWVHHPRMDCPHCERLRQQFSSEAEKEAKATLAQRSSWLGFKLPGNDVKFDTLQTLIAESRRKQAHLSELLREHESVHHTAA